MEAQRNRATNRWIRSLGPGAVATAVTLISLTTGGCTGLLGHIGYWSGASLVQPAYDGLEDHRVAVICVSDTSSYGAGTEEKLLSRKVSDILEENIEEIEMVPESEIADWIDRNDWDKLDYREVGRGVKADRVIAIDMAGFRLHQDKVLYKARADLTIMVFDMTDGGREVLRKSVPEITYPSTGYYHTTDTPEATFRRIFVDVLAARAARYFYPYDSFGESNMDPAHIGS